MKTILVTSLLVGDFFGFFGTEDIYLLRQMSQMIDSKGNVTNVTLIGNYVNGDLDDEECQLNLVVPGDLVVKLYAREKEEKG